MGSQIIASRKGNMKRKITIVIEETGTDGGKGFNVYMSGDKERLGKIPEAEYSPAEIWGSKLFSICTSTLRACGAIKTVNGTPVAADGN